ncbi:uncharacterized BrkB/YihY/UPF0761 family membrane protein [Sphingopyxis sp. OAS728]|uniref:DUF4328 domain-containing protein n=1 Tax=Sphingopyxis sp. OAS728 TaxID=2663823 RepID=UPI001789BEF7|nr:DUF4328 domain-containing protein [Sphingopyxis sp. OAS728]MBE1525646.1 uncharacterized BrkB/YihY/UPF0761 family membrane protein [Sphingopyxis sp. OAS728]
MAEMNLGDGIELLQRRAKIVKTLLIVGFAVTVALLAGEIGEINGDIILANPDPTPMEQLYLAVLLVNTLVSLVTIVFFAMWIYRAAANVVAAGIAGFDFTPGWAVGWYFVPFANLVQPFRAMRQIWNASHAGGSDIDRGDPILTLWWTVWLASNISANISIQMSFRATSTEMVSTSLYLGAISSVLSLVLFVVGMRLVERVTEAQRDRLSPAHIFA